VPDEVPAFTTENEKTVMTDQMRPWLMRGVIALVFLILGVALGWVLRGPGSSSNVGRILVYDDWRLVCPKDDEPKASCQLATELVDQKSGTPLAQLALTRVDDKPTVSIRVPLTVLIPAGVGLQFGSDTKSYQYATCSPVGCFAFIPADDKLLDQLKSASSVSVVVTVSQNGKSAALPMSTKGYADGLKALNNIEGRRHSWWRRLWS
jgi:invasion protein IalB